MKRICRPFGYAIEVHVHEPDTVSITREERSSADDHNWSKEAFRIFEFDPATRVTLQMIRDV